MKSITAHINSRELENLVDRIVAVRRWADEFSDDQGTIDRLVELEKLGAKLLRESPVFRT